MGVTYESEREIPEDRAESFRDEIHRFISAYQQTPVFLMTFRRDGTPRMRPVAAFVDGWTIGTITQDLHVKTGHVRNNPIVAYLWVDTKPGEARAWSPRNVFVQGRADLIDDSAVVQAFFERRRLVTGSGDAHPHDHDYRRILIRVTPQYLRAEGFAEEMRPVIYRTFPGIAVPVGK